MLSFMVDIRKTRFLLIRHWDQTWLQKPSKLSNKVNLFKVFLSGFDDDNLIKIHNLSHVTTVRHCLGKHDLLNLLHLRFDLSPVILTHYPLGLSFRQFCIVFCCDTLSMIWFLFDLVCYFCQLRLWRMVVTCESSWILMRLSSS